jgi:chromosome partitioning protein
MAFTAFGGRPLPTAQGDLPVVARQSGGQNTASTGHPLGSGGTPSLGARVTSSLASRVPAGHAELTVAPLGQVMGRTDLPVAVAATPVVESRHVSRETSPNPAVAPSEDAPPIVPNDDFSLAPDVSRETSFDTPIAREAMQAVHVRNVRQEVWPRPAARRVITIANQKGGVGKTTTTVNVAVALAQHGLRVLVIDLDPQGNASTALSVEHTAGTPSIYDVLLGESSVSEVAVSVEAAPTLYCVPATIDLAGADIELASQVAREYRLRRAIEAFVDEVDYVLIDCPPTLGLLTLNALVAAREILIPIQCEYYALEGLAQLVNTVELVKTQLNAELEISSVLLTMYDSRTRLADQVADEVRNHFGDKVIKSVIPRNVRVSEAPGYGQTVMTYDAGSRGAVGYLEAAREVAQRGADRFESDDGDSEGDGDVEQEQR